MSVVRSFYRNLLKRRQGNNRIKDAWAYLQKLWRDSPNKLDRIHRDLLDQAFSGKFKRKIKRQNTKRSVKQW